MLFCLASASLRLCVENGFLLLFGGTVGGAATLARTRVLPRARVLRRDLCGRSHVLLGSVGGATALAGAGILSGAGMLRYFRGALRRILFGRILECRGSR